MGLTTGGPQNRTPQELITELRGLTHVHWETVWNGPPYPGKGLDMWCAQFGWTPTQFERVLNVRTDTGGELTLSSLGRWAPVRSLDHWVWGAAAETAADNPLVLAEAARAWPLYVTAASSVLGEPAWEGAWDSVNFPSVLPRNAVPREEDRVQEKDPYRIAYWEPASEGSHLVSLSVKPSLGTADGSDSGAANMALRVYPRPVESGRR
ncbi:hypothetical protein NX801_04990 [Streptomyces sp. LP05-1]|uniref:Uncharacterized protein n=1 Tax=Streptomyces pyxinae TaxID=2970734 RepID=A0ABT2CC91_9ACTN|nr:hypothetical protein [Streptomyces sp. LP05-1]MCS0635023.1 hypothetical protein [Streptomyces sp. LP05-1]